MRRLALGQADHLGDDGLPARARVPDGRVLSRKSPSTPCSAMKRSCQRQTHGLDLPVRRVISTVPQPADIMCEGRGAARAHAFYAVRPDGFSGRIAMVLGAKNMTMRELQVGHRVREPAGFSLPIGNRENEFESKRRSVAWLPGVATICTMQEDEQ